MRIEGDTIIFKSVDTYFVKEKDGRKPNTVRILDEYESGIVYNRWYSGSLKKIRIELITSESPDSFERELTDITWCGSAFGRDYVIFSWRHEE